MRYRSLKPQPLHYLLLDHLEKLERGEIQNLNVAMPPGSAKSTYGSYIFPPWAMARAEACGDRLMCLGAAHTDDFADFISGRVIGVVQESGKQIGLELETDGKKGWATKGGSEYKPVGVGGTITGRRGDIGMIDDPVKSAKDAKSLVVREATWEWYLNDFLTRLKPGGRQALIMTRWHEDDLAGRIFKHWPADWTQLIIRAESDGPDDDPLGREKGVMLWSDDADYAYGDLLKKRKWDYEKAGALTTWESLYQQRPSAPDGDIFKPEMIKIVHEVPAGTKFVRGWDFAATDQGKNSDPDWTAGVRLGLCPDGSYLIAHCKRFRGGPDVVERELETTSKLDTRTVTQSLPQDPGAAGKTVVFNFVRLLAGFDVQSSPESGDKASRAGPYAAQVNIGNVKMLFGDWNGAMLDEMRQFPNGTHDDTIDAGSRAFAAVLQTPPPATTMRLPFMRR
jgi:predicted phage terminase large subunit-like protein